MSYDYQNTNRTVNAREPARNELGSRIRGTSHSYRFPRLSEAPTGAIDLLFSRYDALTETNRPTRKAGKAQR